MESKTDLCLNVKEKLVGLLIFLMYTKNGWSVRFPILSVKKLPF